MRETMKPRERVMAALARESFDRLPIRHLAVAEVDRRHADPQDSRDQYRCEFRGQTAVDVERVVASGAPDEQPLYRLLRREAMKSAMAPEKPMPAYVHPEKLVDWEMVV